MEFLNNPLIPEAPRLSLVLGKRSLWIDSHLLQRWKWTCDHRHGKRCRAAPVNIHSYGPTRLIDTWRKRLVTDCPEDNCIALSYVWVGTSYLSTVNHIIRHLQLDNAFTNLDLLNRIPRTIRDAMCVVDLSHERYLWVDSICILQDDEVKKQERPKHLMRWSKSPRCRIPIQSRQYLSGMHYCHHNGLFLMDQSVMATSSSAKRDINPL